MNLISFKKAVGAADISFRENEPMRLHTSFAIGGPAELFIELKSIDKVEQLLALVRQYEVPLTVVGNGSNLLVSDLGIDGAVLKFCDDTISVNGDEIECAAGAKLSALSSKARASGLGGAEFAWGIPGTVGGAIFMNAGAYGGEIKQIITSCRSITLDGKTVVRNNEELKLGYRTSIFKENDEIILSAKFKLSSRDKDKISHDMDDYMSRRKEKQPIELPSAGSTFKRPEGHFAGALIEQCGLKGAAVGGAEVSTKHAGFIVNKGGATADDVKKLIEKVRDTVLTETGVLLEPEVVFKGR